MSRPQDESPTTPKRSSRRSPSPVEVERRAGRNQAGTEPSSSPLSSEGYPSWLPKRPPPPAPRSTIHSASITGMFSEPGPSSHSDAYPIGRKPTPRSVRVVSLHNSPHAEKDVHGRRISIDPSRLMSGPHSRAWSRDTSPGISPTVSTTAGNIPHVVRPRFRAPSFRPELLRNPSWKMRLWFFLFPVLVFLHLALQTFFDFNAVFILLLVAKYPNASAPGVSGSGRNWALGAAAYIACWATQIFVVFIVYELIYSFIRRWRAKRPIILPLYLSASAFNFTAMTSYTNFCFMYHIRLSAFSREHGSLREGLAETFYYYSQNLPTVALLLPRAALSLALLLAFWSPQAGELALIDSGTRPRDGTYFRSSDQTLTNYARGVLIANAAWTAWRLLVLFVSWTGLWVLSGQGCAGLCGPRYRWEEEDAEKTMAALGDNLSDADALAWSWKECTLGRIIDAFEFCLTNKMGYHVPEKTGTPSETQGGAGFEDKVLAAIGLGGSQQSRRGVLSEDFFRTPAAGSPEHGGLSEVVSASEEEPDIRLVTPPAAVVRPNVKHAVVPSGSLKNLPYAFTGSQAQISSEEAIPFPPSPEPEDREADVSGNTEEHEEEEEEEEIGVEVVEGSDEPSEGRRTSGSMSSLGQPLPSRYPFEYRGRGRGSVSSASHMSPRTVSTTRSQQTGSTPSRSVRAPSTPISRSTQSTGNRESSDSPYPQSSNPSNAPSPSSFNGAGIPMPPRHPHRRQRAGTVPSASVTSSPTPAAAGRPRARTRTESARTRTESAATAVDMSMTFGPGALPLHMAYESDEGPPDDSLMDVPEAEGSVEEAEQSDSVGLLSAGASPRASHTSLVRNLGPGRSPRSRSGTGSRSGSRSRSISTASHSESARSRAQSFIHSLHAASHSSIELVRSRANSMARMSDSPYYSSSPDPAPSSPENYTFGHPLRAEWREQEAAAAHGGDVIDLSEPPVPRSAPRSRATSSSVPAIPEEVSTPSVTIRQRLTSEASAVSEPGHVPSTIAEDVPEPPPAATSSSPPLAIPGRATRAVESMPDISTAHQSLVTGPPTIQGVTDSTGRTPSSWGTATGAYPAEQRGAFEPA